jgi:hypothetical protein
MHTPNIALEIILFANPNAIFGVAGIPETASFFHLYSMHKHLRCLRVSRSRDF